MATKCGSVAWKATITRWDLSPRLFCIDCTNVKEIRYESTSVNGIVADKSHCVVVAGQVRRHHKNDVTNSSLFPQST